MSLLAWLFGRTDRPAPPPRAERIATMRFGFIHQRRTVRRTAEVVLVPPGRYRLALLSTGNGAYAPDGSFAPAGWHHAVHMVGCAPPFPLRSGETGHGDAIAHRIFVNRDDSGPHRTGIEARNAFRAIPEDQLCLDVECETRLIFWIEADPERGDGRMELELLKLP